MSGIPHPELFEESKIRSKIDRVISKLHRASKFPPLLGFYDPASIEKDTRTICSYIIERIDESHPSIDAVSPSNYDSFLALQLILMTFIAECEDKSREMKKSSKHEELQLIRERRRLLRYLGSTIAWILFDYDRQYIQAMSLGHDSGFISGKEGNEAELASMIAYHEVEHELTTVLHSITHCLRVGDLTLTDGLVKRPLEIKMEKSSHKPDRRELRQKRKLDTIYEYMEKGSSKQLVKGQQLVFYKSKRVNTYNFTSLAKACENALRDGSAIEFPEQGIAYGAYAEDSDLSKIGELLKNKWKEPHLIIGYLKDGMNFLDILPFTCFDIPFAIKEKILFGDLNVFTLVDLNGLCKTFCDYGMEATIEVNGNVVLKANGVKSTFGQGTMNRLLYECITIDTICMLNKDVPVDMVSPKLTNETGPYDS